MQKPGQRFSKGEFIRDLRKKLGMTQRQFAELFRMDVTSISQWENNHHPPSRTIWERIVIMDSKRGA